jgi:hypothetical protein
MAGFIISDNTYTTSAQKEKRKMAEGDFTHPALPQPWQMVQQRVILTGTQSSESYAGPSNGC